MASPFEQHQIILAAAEELLAGLRQSPQISMQELNRLRNRMATLIRAHHRTEEQEIFGPLFRNGGLEQLPGVLEALRNVKEQKSRYSESIQRWTPQTIEADRDGYARSVATRVGSLRAMIRFEEEHIYRPTLEFIAGLSGERDRHTAAGR